MLSIDVCQTNMSVMVSAIDAHQQKQWFYIVFHRCKSKSIGFDHASIDVRQQSLVLLFHLCLQQTNKSV